MRILLTGAAGFVGRHLGAALSAAGHDVIGTDTSGAGLVLDLRDRQATVAAVSAMRPDVVVHAGAISGPMLAQDDPALMFDVNVGGTVNLVEGMRLAGVRRLAHLSSVAVYRPRPGDRSPVPPTAALASATPYGASKVAAEAVVEAYSNAAGLDAWILRISSIYGPGRISPYLMSELAEAGRRGGSAAVTDARSNMRQFIHVEDVVDCLVAAVGREAGGCVPLNVSGGDYVAEVEIGRIVQRLLPALRLDVVEDRGAPGDGDIGPLDLTDTARLLGFTPRVSLEQGLAMLLG